MVAASGLPAKTIRYYEDIGLVRPARSAKGYRALNERDARKLNLLGRAGSLGFSINECRTFLSPCQDRERASADLNAVAAEHLDPIAQKIEELQATESTLDTLVTRCHCDDRPHCPTLNGLAGFKADEL